MDILLNEWSIEGQFTIDSFLDYMQSDVIPSLKLLEQNNCILYKEYTTYSRKITPNKELFDIFKIRGNPIIDELITYLHQISNAEPFWNDDVRTKSDVSYSCIISDIPNCITEAYERKGMLFSFLNERFRDKILGLKLDGENIDVRNAYTYNILREHLNELGVINLWDKNSFIIRNTGYQFIIWFNEEHHNIAHFHVKNVDYNASLSIPDADIIAGDLPSDDKKKIESWALMNMDKIVELWNKFHPEKMVRNIL